MNRARAFKPPRGLRAHVLRIGWACVLAACSVTAMAAPSFTASILPSSPAPQTLPDGGVAAEGFSVSTMFSRFGQQASQDGITAAGVVSYPWLRHTQVSAEPWNFGSSGDLLLTYKVPHTDAFVRRDGQVERFGVAGMDNNGVIGFNRKGQVLGQAENVQETAILQSGFGIPLRSSFLTTQSQPFLYENGVVTPLGTLGGQRSWGVAINNNGVVLGNSGLQGDNTNQAFLYSNGQMQALGPVGSSATALNDRGDVIGAAPGADGAFHAFFYSQGQFQDLSVSGNRTSAVALNENGDVLLNATPDIGLTGATPYLYKNGKLKAIEVRDLAGKGVIGTVASDLNAQGMVVGTQFSGDYDVSAFLYMDGEFLNLDSVVDPALGLHFLNAEYLDDMGRVVAFAQDGRRYLLSAVPEAGTMAMMCLGLLGTLLARRGASPRDAA